MQIRDLTLLLAAAEAGSFRRAALKLRMDVASLSRRIARLESELGVLLFERGQAGVRLTVAGESTVELARKTLTNFDAIRRNALANGRSEQGRLRLGTHLASIGPNLRTLIAAWRTQHPAVAFDLTEIDDRALLVGVRERELSAIICFCPLLPPEVATLPLWTERMLIALPAAHPLAAAARIGWTDLRTLPLLVRSWSGSNAYHELQVKLVGPGADFRPQAAGTFNLLNLVAAGEGAMFVMEYHREMAVDGVVLRPIDEPDAIIEVVLAWDQATEDPVAGSFVAFVRDHAPMMRPSVYADTLQTPDPSL